MILTIAAVQGLAGHAAAVVAWLRELAAGVGAVLRGVVRYSAEHPLVIALVVAVIGVIALRPRHTPR